MDKLKNFIEDTLNIINYEGDRQKFVQNLVQAINLMAFNKLLEELDQNGREQALNLMKAPEKNMETLKKLFKTKLDPSKVDQALTATTSDVLLDYFREVSPSLNDEQRSKMQSFFSSFNLQS